MRFPFKCPGQTSHVLFEVDLRIRFCAWQLVLQLRPVHDLGLLLGFLASFTEVVPLTITDRLVRRIHPPPRTHFGDTQQDNWVEDLFCHHAYTPSQSAVHTLGENPDAWGPVVVSHARGP